MPITGSRTAAVATRESTLALASDTELYSVCADHAGEVWTTRVVHWNGETDLRRTSPVELRSAAAPVREVAFA